MLKLRKWKPEFDFTTCRLKDLQSKYNSFGGSVFKNPQPTSARRFFFLSFLFLFFERY